MAVRRILTLSMLYSSVILRRVAPWPSKYKVVYGFLSTSSDGDSPIKTEVRKKRQRIASSSSEDGTEDTKAEVKKTKLVSKLSQFSAKNKDAEVDVKPEANSNGTKVSPEKEVSPVNHPSPKSEPAGGKPKATSVRKKKVTPDNKDKESKKTEKKESKKSQKAASPPPRKYFVSPYFSSFSDPEWYGTT